MANFILTSEDLVRNKLDMLKSLEDMKIATKILQGPKNDFEDVIDQNYKKLNMDIKPLDPKVNYLAKINK